MGNDFLLLLPAFRMVATTGGFTAASGRLGMTPSAVSQKIRQIESLVGTRLFERTSRSVRLTEAGRLLLQNTDRAFSDIENAFDRVRTVEERPAGNLRINLSRLAAQVCILPRMAAFVGHYPDIAVELTTDDRLTDIVAGGFDAGIRFADTLEMDMIARAIGPVLRRSVLASPSYLEAAGIPQHPVDLGNHQLIRYRLPGSQRLVPLTFNIHGQVFCLDPPPRLVFDDNHYFDFAVRAGLGIAQLFRQTEISAIANGELIELLEEFEPRAVQFQLYYPTRAHSPKLQAFIEWFCC
ncbi:LysR substrate-binding domain-containing protein [Sphingomonas sp. PP-CE-1G-424]|uniref:LysR substrate-binding domain-containing protein n=1 Tax=Sphingomonas sp. PP-CE-1G-424 TaxID=2135658 RepID=UPI0010EAC523|nr:LysR substrate-binding domain-containing protein [Sphingomonas sp. PP-CE-1G-424]TCP64301.1 LysR family transcriptional regulator [Sphingomonas sp. PP-CE-1G-424]